MRSLFLVLAVAVGGQANILASTTPQLLKDFFKNIATLGVQLGVVEDVCTKMTHLEEEFSTKMEEQINDIPVLTKTELNLVSVVETVVARHEVAALQCVHLGPLYCSAHGTCLMVSGLPTCVCRKVSDADLDRDTPYGKPSTDDVNTPWHGDFCEWTDTMQAAASPEFCATCHSLGTETCTGVKCECKLPETTEYLDGEVVTTWTGDRCHLRNSQSTAPEKSGVYLEILGPAQILYCPGPILLRNSTGSCVEDPDRVASCGGVCPAGETCHKGDDAVLDNFYWNDLTQETVWYKTKTIPVETHHFEDYCSSDTCVWSTCETGYACDAESGLCKMQAASAAATTDME